MVRHSKPRAGSLQFWPRKRTKRIYPSISHWPESAELGFLGFAGYKAGMTHITIIDNRKNSTTKGDEISVPVSVLDCPPLSVLGFRFYKKSQNGIATFSEVFDAKAIDDKNLKRKARLKAGSGFGKVEKDLESIMRIRAIVSTNPKRSGLGKKRPEIFEIEVSGKDASEKLKFCKEKLGKELKVSDVFKEGEYIDVTAVTKGKGFEGQVKRFGVKRQNRKNLKKRRHIGTLGPEGVRRILYTVPMAGQLGFFRRSEYNKRIVKMGEKGNDVTPKGGFKNYGVVKDNYVLLEGSVPGPRKRLIVLRSPARAPDVKVLKPEIKHITM